MDDITTQVAHKCRLSPACKCDCDACTAAKHMFASSRPPAQTPQTLCLYICAHEGSTFSPVVKHVFDIGGCRLTEFGLRLDGRFTIASLTKDEAETEDLKLSNLTASLGEKRKAPLFVPGHARELQWHPGDSKDQARTLDDALRSVTASGYVASDGHLMLVLDEQNLLDVDLRTMRVASDSGAVKGTVEAVPAEPIDLTSKEGIPFRRFAMQIVGFSPKVRELLPKLAAASPMVESGELILEALKFHNEDNGHMQDRLKMLSPLLLYLGSSQLTRTIVPAIHETLMLYWSNLLQLAVQ